MNRVVNQIAVAGLCLVLLPLAHADKKKKKTDLSANPLADVKSKQPDKELYDKALLALKKGKFDVARLDLQTLLNTYPETEYAMRAKLAIGDTWYREGGSAALQQAENEYKDFITFFPNTPEAAEAQMKVGDIYYQQMEKPDRDPQNVEHAEREYRTMLQDFPDSPLVPRAKQRLREVQEVLAQRQYEIGSFYFGHENWPASIARLQTVADSYPLFSHSDMTLIMLGDAYATQAHIASRLNIPEAAKAKLVKVYNDRAGAAWERVVLRYPEAPHVEDAKDRLIALGRLVPEPSQQQLAESEAEEGSRTNVKLRDRALLLVKHGPSTIQASRVGEPTLTDPAQTIAPDVQKQTVAMFTAAIRNQPLPGIDAQGHDTMAMNIANGTPAAAAPAQPTGGASGTLNLESVPDNSGNTVNVDVNPSGPATGATSAPRSDEATPAPGAAAAAAGGKGYDANAISHPTSEASPDAVVNGPKETPAVPAVKPAEVKALPAVDKPEEAPTQINDVKNPTHAQVATPNPKKKPKNVPYNSSDESSSKHKKKKGLDKLNPF